MLDAAASAASSSTSPCGEPPADASARAAQSRGDGSASAKIASGNAARNAASAAACSRARARETGLQRQMRALRVRNHCILQRRVARQPCGGKLRQRQGEHVGSEQPMRLACPRRTHTVEPGRAAAREQRHAVASVIQPERPAYPRGIDESRHDAFQFSMRPGGRQSRDRRPSCRENVRRGNSRPPRLGRCAGLCLRRLV